MGDQPDELYSFSGIPPFLHCALAAAQCIVIGPVCLCVGGCVCVWVGVFACGWVCYHDNSKLRAIILTKLGLSVKVGTISSWLNFGRPAPPGTGSAAWRNFLAPPYYSQRAVFASPLSAIFRCTCIYKSIEILFWQIKYWLTMIVKGTATWWPERAWRSWIWEWSPVRRRAAISRGRRCRDRNRAGVGTTLDIASRQYDVLGSRTDQPSAWRNCPDTCRATVIAALKHVSNPWAEFKGKGSGLTTNNDFTILEVAAD